MKALHWAVRWLQGYVVCYEACPHNHGAYCKRRIHHLGKHKTYSGFSWVNK